MAYAFNQSLSGDGAQQDGDQGLLSSDDFELLKESVTLSDVLEAADVLRNELTVSEFEEMFPQFKGDPAIFNETRINTIHRALAKDNLGK